MQVSELSETVCIGPPLLLVAGGGGGTDIDAWEAEEQAMAAFCKARYSDSTFHIPLKP